MKLIYTAILTLILLPAFIVGTAYADNSAKKINTDCFESREGYTKITRDNNGSSGYASIGKDEDGPGKGDPYWSNVKCSDRTGGVLWWSDPFTGETIPMGDMPKLGADYDHAEAVVRPRIPQLSYYMPCTACHNGETVAVPKSKKPRQLFMHQDIVADSMNLKHGRGALWCLDCHNAENRDTLIDHFGEEVSFNQPQVLCGKCHGQIYRDWRDGIHGKRTGSWKDSGKRRWWTCTECHNPHDVQPPFKELAPEQAPEFPKGMHNTDHEQHHYPEDSGAQHGSSNGEAKAGTGGGH